MGLINFVDLGIEKDKTLIPIKFNDKEILIRKYISSEDIYDLLMTTLQKSEEKGIYNAFKVDMYFHLNLVYLYTNIVFTPEERADESSLYDALRQSGLLDAILEKIDEDDYKSYQAWLMDIASARIKEQSTFASVINTFLNNMPADLENVMNMLEKVSQSDEVKALLASQGEKPAISVVE